MLSEQEMSAAVGQRAYGTDGHTIGTVEHFFIDDATGAPTWVSVLTGLLGTRHSIAPAVDATYAQDALRLPVTADAVKQAPQVGGDHLDPADEAELRRHYGIPGAGRGDRPQPAAARSPVGTAPTDQEESDRAPSEGSPTDLSSTDEQPTAGAGSAGGAATDGAMTRGEEQLRVSTERVATTRARLVKYVITEEVQVTVPVRREEIRVEHVPLDAPDDGPGESLLPPADASATSGTAGSGGWPDEIVLHAERPVVRVEVVPTERVRLRTEVVTGQETVSNQLQRERIVLEEEPAPRPGP